MTEVTERPAAVLVDVDGVLNAFFKCNKPRETCACHPGWTRLWARPSNGGRFKLTLNPAHGALLRGLADDHAAELVWASYWESEANAWVSPTVGLPDDLPHVPMPRQLRDKYGLGEWKARQVVSWAAGRPFVWFEDEPDAPGALTDSRVMDGLPPLGEHLLLPVDEKVGLTESLVDEARAWLAALK